MKPPGNRGLVSRSAPVVLTGGLGAARPTFLSVKPGGVGSNINTEERSGPGLLEHGLRLSSVGMLAQEAVAAPRSRHGV
ncbi:hypothetical protein EYF80_030984 [Liparis tanakae]|uniref:Uncharacterized protein n=1 Tax=Liparis tanakae TaxID=230148 RepID=A0A4Z2H0F3_9TELE|nr:hypothetical protein EYF80_030984 [Liparis tanakae]